MKIIQEDIDNGKPFDDCECPLALAIRRKYPDASVSVSASTATINDIRYPLSQKAREFVRKFDISREGEPFEFESFF